jgi:hypothetical protein
MNIRQRERKRTYGKSGVGVIRVRAGNGKRGDGTAESHKAVWIQRGMERF